MTKLSWRNKDGKRMRPVKGGSRHTFDTMTDHQKRCSSVYRRYAIRKALAQLKGASEEEAEKIAHSRQIIPVVGEM